VLGHAGVQLDQGSCGRIKLAIASIDFCTRQFTVTAEILRAKSAVDHFGHSQAACLSLDFVQGFRALTSEQGLVFVLTINVGLQCFHLGSFVLTSLYYSKLGIIGQPK
jgi:hypothetical protein